MPARSLLRGAMIVSFDDGVPPSVSAANLPTIDGPICRDQAARNYSRDRKDLRSFASRRNRHGHTQGIETVCSPDCDMSAKIDPTNSESTVRIL